VAADPRTAGAPQRADLRRARQALASCWAPGGDERARSPHRADRPARRRQVHAGPALADDLGYAFIELSREIEKFAGCSISEIHNLYGTNAYRRYERRALEEAIQIYPEVVIATPAGWCPTRPTST
jgi:XRE family aerobic/anaerobic benzoate catabolism transcriptional regulator